MPLPAYEQLLQLKQERDRVAAGPDFTTRRGKVTKAMRLAELQALLDEGLSYFAAELSRAEVSELKAPAGRDS